MSKESFKVKSDLDLSVLDFFEKQAVPIHHPDGSGKVLVKFWTRSIGTSPVFDAPLDREEINLLVGNAVAEFSSIWPELEEEAHIRDFLLHTVRYFYYERLDFSRDRSNERNYFEFLSNRIQDFIGHMEHVSPHIVSFINSYREITSSEIDLNTSIRDFQEFKRRVDAHIGTLHISGRPFAAHIHYIVGSFIFLFNSISDEKMSTYSRKRSSGSTFVRRMVRAIDTSIKLETIDSAVRQYPHPALTWHQYPSSVPSEIYMRPTPGD